MVTKRYFQVHVIRFVELDDNGVYIKEKEAVVEQQITSEESAFHFTESSRFMDKLDRAINIAVFDADVPSERWNK